MLYITSTHLLEFAFMLLTGMVLFGICLLFAALRRAMCAGIWLSLVCDILMGVIWAAIFSLAVTLASEGRIRLYHPLSAALGAAIAKGALCIPTGCYAGIRKQLRRLGETRFIRMLIK